MGLTRLLKWGLDKDELCVGESDFTRDGVVK
jgi:hypothetical protein